MANHGLKIQIVLKFITLFICVFNHNLFAAETVKIGGRFQGVAESNLTSGGQDLYLRRARINLSYIPFSDRSDEVVMDLRSDEINRGNSGTRELSIGDAFYQISLGNGLIQNIRFFRAKVDVSYSQTASSKDLINPARTTVSDHAASFINQSRRATNIQVNGGNSWLQYQLSIGDGIQSEDVDSLFGNVEISSIRKQSLMVGGKARVFLWGDKLAPTESFYKETDTFSVGIGYFHNHKIEYLLTNGRTLENSRKLLNVEISISVGPWRLLAEGFRFYGDTINLSQAKFGDSHGAYFKSEFLIGKFAPFIGVTFFDKDLSQTGAFEETQEYGASYYFKENRLRVGMLFANTNYGGLLSGNDYQKVQTYIMMNY